MPRVLLATDLSEAAGVAERLIGSIPWPAGTAFRAVTVVPWLSDLVGTPWTAVAPLHADEVEASQLKAAETGIREVVARMAAHGRNAAWTVMRGRASDAIVELAEKDGADLVVLGSRGLGALEGALLGSVSEAVADRAPCPVLIARGETIDRSLIASDASPGAQLAVDYACRHPYLLGARTTLLGVTDRTEIWAETFDMPIDAHSVQVLADDRRELRHEIEADLESAAQRLRAGGTPAEARMLEGRPGPEIVDEALVSRADLVVVGSRHRTGITRLVLGSVGRHVLHHSPCSVLFVGSVPRVAPVAGVNEAPRTTVSVS